MAKGCSKLQTLSAIWLQLQLDFRALINDRIDSNGNGSSLLKLVSKASPK